MKLGHGAGLQEPSLICNEFQFTLRYLVSFECVNFGFKGSYSGRQDWQHAAVLMRSAARQRFCSYMA